MVFLFFWGGEGREEVPQRKGRTLLQVERVLLRWKPPLPEKMQSITRMQSSRQGKEKPVIQILESTTCPWHLV